MKTKPYKIIDKTADALTIEGYIAIWGDETELDLDNEFFHKDTDFKSSYN